MLPFPRFQAERLVKDKSLVGDGKERRKLEAITCNNIASTYRRRCAIPARVETPIPIASH